MRLPFIDLDFTCKVTIRIGLDYTGLDFSKLFTLLER